MTTTTSVHSDIFDALDAAGLNVVYGPADDLPTGADGRIEQTVVLWPAAGLHQYTRNCGTSSGRLDRVTITCVGATAFDALAVADKVEAAVGGLMLSGKGGTLQQTIASPPVPEVNADPGRVSISVEYATITKG